MSADGQANQRPARVEAEEEEVLQELDQALTAEMAAEKPRHEKLAVLLDVEDTLKRRMSGGSKA